MLDIFWTVPASTDLDNIYSYIAEDSENYANLFVSKIVSAVSRLSEYPEIGRTVPEISLNDIRELIYKNYRIIYTIEGNALFILAVIHGSRDLYRILEDWEII